MHLIFIISVFSSHIFAQGAAIVHDPLNGAIMQAGQVNNKLYQTFMQLQVVQDALMIKNNVLEAESYYDYINNASKSRGGLVGFYKNMAMAEINQIVTADKFALEQQATTITGPNAVDDFMAAASVSAINAVQSAGTAANSTAGSAVSGFNAVYNNATNYQVADANLVVRTWQQQQNVQNGQLAKQVAISSAVASQLAASNFYVANLDTALNNLAQTATQPNLTDQQHEQIHASYSAINAKLLVQTHHMLNIQATLIKTLLDSQSAAQALAQQAAADINAFKSYNAMQRAKYGGSASAITAELQR